MKKINNVVWGVIGAGDVCEIKSVPAMYQLENSRVKTVMRRNAEKAEDYAKRHKIENWTTDIEQILQDPEINIIYIATPPSSHASLTIRAAKAGKAVYVEKPMAITNEECEEMIDECNHHQVPIYVAYYRRTLPGFLKVKEIVESGLLGEIRSVKIEMYQPLQPELVANSSSNWRIVPEISGGGYFHDLASHQLDFLDFLFGSIDSATGFTGNQAGQYDATDIVSANFRFKNGIIGNGIWCFSTGKCSEKDETTIVGSNGQLSYNSFGDPMIIKIKTDTQPEEVLYFSHKQPIQKPLIHNIIQSLTKGESCISTGLTASRTTKIINQITQK